MTNETKNNRQEKIVISIGFLLVILVAIITFLRETEFKNKNNAPAKDTSISAQEKIKNIPIKEFQDKILRKESVTLLDIRSSEFYNEEHILDSLNFPFDQLENFTAPDSSKQLFLITQTAKEAEIEKAFNLLKNKGVRTIYLLSGGMDAWKEADGQLITSGDPTSFANQAKVNLISAEELKEAIDSESVFIIDTRSQASFNQGHLKSAINIPFEELEKRRNEIKLNKSIVTYDENEVYGFQSAARIFDLINIPAFNLRGGLENWKNNNLELVQ